MKPTVTLRKKEDGRIRAGHAWVFSNEIEKINGEPGAGDIVAVHAHGGSLLGIGFFHPHSLIAVRMLGTLDEEISFQFFRTRIERAADLRKLLYPETAAVRLVHGEADFLPGLIIDRYLDHFVVQTLSFGMETRLTLLCDVLESMFRPTSIIARNEGPLRTLEGLPQEKKTLRGSASPVIIEEHGISYRIDMIDGQKTGFFLDQRENRSIFRRYANGAEVLDCYCNDGGFALNAVRGGAAATIGVDVSHTAVTHASANAVLNNMTRHVAFTEEDAFGFLRRCAKEERRFDVINLDPPSFAKNRKNVTTAKQGYRELHGLALAILRPQGILATSCCSHHINEETFLDVIRRAAHDKGRDLQLLEWHGAAPDHPVLPSMPETEYLKFGIFRVS